MDQVDWVGGVAVLGVIVITVIINSWCIRYYYWVRYYTLGLVCSLLVGGKNFTGVLTTKGKCGHACHTSPNVIHIGRPCCSNARHVSRSAFARKWARHIRRSRRSFFKGINQTQPDAIDKKKPNKKKGVLRPLEIPDNTA